MAVRRAGCGCNNVAPESDAQESASAAGAAGKPDAAEAAGAGGAAGKPDAARPESGARKAEDDAAASVAADGEAEDLRGEGVAPTPGLGHGQGPSAR